MRGDGARRGLPPRVGVRPEFLHNRGFVRRLERGCRLKRGSPAPSGNCALEATAGSQSHPRTARLVARLDDHEAGQVIGELKEGAAGVLSGGDALEAGLDASYAEFAHLIGGIVARFIGMGESLLPKDNLFVNAIPKERGKIRKRRTGWRQRAHGGSVRGPAAAVKRGHGEKLRVDG